MKVVVFSVNRPCKYSPADITWYLVSALSSVCLETALDVTYNLFNRSVDISCTREC